MSESISEKIQRHASLFFYIFTPQHIKDVCVGMVTTYETPKIITIKSYPIAIICRFVQSLIFMYAVGYIMWYKHGYQDRDPTIISAVTLKVKGIGTYGTDPQITLDNADFIIPPQENNALFIMTNFVSTDQKRTRCAEGAVLGNANCTNHAQCQAKLRSLSKSNGRWTGQCRMSERRCEMEGWCPVENDLEVPPPIMAALNYTIFVNNFIEFTRFKVKRKNIFDESNYRRKCLYHPEDNKYCPIFRIGDLLKLVESDEEERHNMLKFGAVIRMKIDWMCNLDWGADECRPHYSFGRLDSRSMDEQFSLGFNFRYASHWKMNKESHRTLKKAFGLRLVVTVNGDAGRFDLFVLTLNIGSMIGVLGLATVICDIIALYFSNQGYIYRRQKFQSVYLKRGSVASVSIANSKRRRRTRIREPINYPPDGRSEF